MLRTKSARLLHIFILFVSGILTSFAAVDKVRVVWETNPDREAILIWNQISGSNPIVFFSDQDYGQVIVDYRQTKGVDQVSSNLDMNTQYVRFTDLRPNTRYYFIISDTEGKSKRYSFKTAPSNPNVALSIIAGGDSRNNRPARQNANRMVSKILPTCVMFSGDMTANGSALEWKNWLDDWQLTFGNNGEITPLIVARGNHERDNQMLREVFGLKNQNIYYAMSLGGELLRVYTLNSLISPAPGQSNWLSNDLDVHQRSIWRIAQYHNTIIPHTQKKKPRLDLLKLWAPIFFKKNVQLVLESDSHVLKATHPVRPSVGPGSEKGFIRDDQNGTVYLGEGCWGAPLRSANINHSWTKYSGSFNQFKLIYVQKEKIEIRIIPTDNFTPSIAGSNMVDLGYLSNDIPIWKSNDQGVIVISNPEFQDGQNSNSFNLAKGIPSLRFFDPIINSNGNVLQFEVTNLLPNLRYILERSEDGGQNFYELRSGICSDLKRAANKFRLLDPVSSTGKEFTYRITLFMRDKVIETKRIVIKPPGRKNNWNSFDPLYSVDGIAEVTFQAPKASNQIAIRILSTDRQEIQKIPISVSEPGLYRKKINVSSIPSGTYIIIVFDGKEPIKKYKIQIP